MNARCLIPVAVAVACLSWLTSIAAAQTPGSVTGWGASGSGQLTPFPASATNIVSVAAGGQHSLALRSDGTVVGWGQNAMGQLNFPAGITSVRAIAAGLNHTLLLLSNGTVLAWGDAGSGATNVPVGLNAVRDIAAGQYFSMALRSNGTVVVWGSGTVTAANGLTSVKAIAAGGTHAMAMMSNGTVAAWGGSNVKGELTVPTSLVATQIAAGYQFSLAVQNGTAVVWGDNTYGQRNGNGLTGVRRLFAGQNHAGAVKNDGSVVCWGDNTSAQVTPLPAGLTNVTVVASSASANHNLAAYLTRPSIDGQPQSQSVPLGSTATFNVSASGTPTLSYQWRKDGTNILGATGPSYSVNNAQSTNAGGYTVVVTNIVGSVTSLVATLTVNALPVITNQPQSQTVAVGSNVTFVVGVVGSPTLRYQWKKNGSNIGNATNASYSIASASANDSATYSVVITNSYGTATSSNAALTVVPPPGFVSHPQSQSALLGTSVTLRPVVTNATEYQWLKNGTNLPGANSVILTFNRVVAEDAGDYRLLASNPYGSAFSSVATLTIQQPAGASDVTMWGQDALLIGDTWLDLTPPAGLANLKAIAAGDYFSLALRADGTVVGWGDNTFGQAGLPPTLNATSIVAGANHTLVITNRQVGAWGLNTSGQATAPQITNVIAIAAGGNVSMALRQDGNLFVWGDNSFGQTNVPPTAATNVMNMAAGLEHCLALRRNGTVIGWSTANTYGEARAPFAATNVNAAVAAIAAGAYHSLALKSNGTVLAWGRGDFGQTNVPVAATNIIAIAAAGNHSVALRGDGVVFAWGQDNYGQVDVPQGLIASAIAAGGSRSLAISKTALRLFGPIRAANNQLLYQIRNVDGSFPSILNATNVDVLATTNVSLPPANWPAASATLTVTNGIVYFFDTTNSGSKFYKLRLR